MAGAAVEEHEGGVKPGLLMVCGELCLGCSVAVIWCSCLGCSSGFLLEDHSYEQDEASEARAGEML